MSDVDPAVDVAAVPAAACGEAVPIAKGRGRPRGSKDKPGAERKKGSGRPLGAKAKAAVKSGDERKKGSGRPRGSKAIAPVKSGDERKKGSGRKPGSKNKPRRTQGVIETDLVFLGERSQGNSLAPTGAKVPRMFDELARRDVNLVGKDVNFLEPPPPPKKRGRKKKAPVGSVVVGDGRTSPAGAAATSDINEGEIGTAGVTNVATGVTTATSAATEVTAAAAAVATGVAVAVAAAPTEDTNAAAVAAAAAAGDATEVATGVGASADTGDVAIDDAVVDTGFNVGLVGDDADGPTISFEGPSGWVDLPEIQANFDDSVEEPETTTGVNLMKQIMIRLGARLLAELNRKGTSNVSDTWLKEYLISHGFWVRSEALPTIARKLGFEKKKIVKQYLRDIRLWMPELEVGHSCMPHCPSCGQSSRVGSNGFNRSRPGRRIITFNTHYYIMSPRYRCLGCKSSNHKWSFMATDEKCMEKYPRSLAMRFPAILSHRSGIDKTLSDILRPLTDNGVSFKAITASIKELQSLTYYRHQISHQSELKSKKNSNPFATDHGLELLSSFDDKNGYNGAVPSASYLTTMHKKRHDKIRPYMDRQMKYLPKCDVLAIDCSYKCMGKTTYVNGKPVLKACQTACGDYGMIRCQVATVTDGQDQIFGALQAMRESNRKMGRADPSFVVTDNPARDKRFLMEKVFNDSLTATQRRLDAHSLTGMTNQSSVQPIVPMETQRDGPNKETALPFEFEMVSSFEDITNKLLALQDHYPPGRNLHFSLDAEWRAAQPGGKRGKVALLQLAYQLPDEDKVSVLLMKMNTRNESIPGALVSFLSKQNHFFVGVRVKHDLQFLFDDYGVDRSLPENHVRSVELGRYAKSRDVVQNANVGLQEIYQLLQLGELPKPKDVRISDWEAPNLSPEQQQYAAADAFAGLRVFHELAKLPDLSLRLDQNSCEPGTIVDIVPPHARKNRDRIMAGFGKDHDLTTRGAIGEILPLGESIQLPSSVNPQKYPNVHRCMADGKTTCRVRVTKVFAEALMIPNLEIRVNGKRQRRACLGDFVREGEGDTFDLLLPMTMLRKHDSSVDVRNFGGSTQVNVQESARRRSKPGRPSAMRLAPRLAEEHADDNDEELEDIADLFFDLINRESVENPEEADARLEQDLDAVRTAELCANQAEFENFFDSLFCELLGPVPEVVRNKFSCVLGDIFHAIDRVKVPTRHEWRKAFKHALMKAFLEWDFTKLEKVKKALLDKGWTEQEFESTLYYKPSFFRKRVPRVALPPAQLYYRVRAVFVTFGNRIDSKTNVPLFNSAAWGKAKNLLNEILESYYSDPPGMDWYFYELDSKKNIKKDQYGIELIRSSRGTNMVENVHRQYNTTFRHRSGIEIGDALLAERRHRHNIDVARRNYVDYPDVGHYDTWVVDCLQELLEYNTGKVLYHGWQSVCDFEDTDESFVLTPLHSADLQEALEVRVAELQKNPYFKLRFSSDVEFLSRAWGVPIPFLPVTGNEEYKLFSKLMLQKMKKFDAEQMAMLWIEYVDGKSIMPKLPVQLKTYHRDWERNRRIQAQQERAAPDMRLLDTFMKQVSSPPRTAEKLVNQSSQPAATLPPTMNQLPTDQSSQPAATLPPTMNQLPTAMPWVSQPVTWLPPPTIQLPPLMPRPIVETARRSEDAGVVRVDGQIMSIRADGEASVNVVCLNRRGKRKSTNSAGGPHRAKRACALCSNSGDAGRISMALMCPGTGGRRYCMHSES